MRPALGRRGDDVEVRQEQQRVAAGAVAAEPRDHAAAAGRGLQDLGREAGRAQLGGDRWAASSSGPGGSGGLIDGIRIRACRQRDELVVGPIPRRGVDAGRRQG